MAISPKKALFALIPALMLAACSTPTGAPSQTPDVACDPATATITWSPATDVGRVPAGVQLVTYTDGGANRSVEVTTLDPGITVSEDALVELGDGWQQVLLDDLDRTGQVDENFGAVPQISDEPAGEPATPIDGQFVVAVDAPLSVVPFTVDCGSSSVEGQVSAINGGLGFTLLDCADTAAADASQAEITAREYCDPA